MFATHIRSACKPAVSLCSSVSAVTILAVALALSTVPAWADGGNGSSAGAGQGGVDGALAGATGQNAANGATAGGGGGGVDLTTGNGASGGSGGTASTSGSPNGIPGATGAAGQIISTSGTISTSVSGGAGGGGAASGSARAGGGGGGGVGLRATADVTITGTGLVIGGIGGRGGNGGNAGSGGGGAGIFSSANVVVELGGSVIGGTSGTVVGAQAGGGGGAAAIVLTGGGTIQNSGNLLGGAGGRAILGGGGDGAAGVLLLSGGTVINGSGGTIIGGTGGQGSLAGGDGGAGIKGANFAVINAGTITGGAAGAGGGTPVAGKAIEFTGGVNSLEIQAGSTITGNVVAFSTADTFKLGGDTSASFDMSQIGPGAKYDGFGFYDKTGNSTWTLTGTTAAVTPWTLSGGVLQISSDSNLGAASGNLTFDGGTLRTTASFATNRNVLINSTGTFDTAAGTQLDVSGKVTGTGTLIKNGAGTLNVTSYSNNYTGGNIVNGGTLAGNTVAIRGDILNNGAVSFLDLGPNTFSGNISGSGSLDIEGIGTLILTGTNTHSGGTKIGVGKSVSVASDQNLGAATGLLTFDGGELQATASFAMSRDIDLTPAISARRRA